MAPVNPLFDVSSVVPFDAIEPAHLEPAVDALLARSKAALDAVGNAPPTYAATLGVIDQATAGLDWVLGVASHLESTVGTPAIREAFGAVQPRVAAFYSGIPTSSALFGALRAFAETDEAKSLDPARARFLEKTLADFQRNGAALDDAGKAKLLALDVELTEATLKFSQNVVDATSAYELLVEDASRLAGLPEAVLEATAKDAKERGKKGHRLTLHAPVYGPVVTYAEDRALREALFRAHATRASSGPFDNRALMRRILELRHERARLLGFRDFADLAIDDRMAKTGAGAAEFVASLRARLEPAFRAEANALEAFARARGHQGGLAAWDVPFYAERQRKELHDLDDEALRPYFPLEGVLQGLFAVVEQLYGVRTEPWLGASTWHPSVRAYRFVGEGGESLGGFYLDPFPRDTKRDGAWMAGVLDRGTAPESPGDAVAVVVANVTPPRGDGAPALLTHREVQTLFHEFGHLLHHCLSRTTVRSQFGTRVVSDFVELPSMIHENWAWEPSALALFAKHHQTGAPIPDDLVARMRGARTYRAATAMMRQLGFSTVDLALHRGDGPGARDVLELARETFQPFTPTPLPPEYAMVASFSHLFGSPYGYAAGYYSYQWSEVLDADAFTRFAEAGVLDAATGRAFARTVLERGDSADPNELFREFVGRAPDVGSLARRLGVG